MSPSLDPCGGLITESLRIREMGLLRELPSGSQLASSPHGRGLDKSLWSSFLLHFPSVPPRALRPAPLPAPFCATTSGLSPAAPRPPHMGLSPPQPCPSIREEQVCGKGPREQLSTCCSLVLPSPAGAPYPQCPMGGQLSPRPLRESTGGPD